ncbi:MAG: hypothetical protein ACPKQO_10380 [Nitrososphaeraceae archaeon]
MSENVTVIKREINENGFAYDYYEYRDHVIGKCREINGVVAQGKTIKEVRNILHRMINDYLRLIKTMC